MNISYRIDFRIRKYESFEGRADALIGWNGESLAASVTVTDDYLAEQDDALGYVLADVVREAIAKGEE